MNEQLVSPATNQIKPVYESNPFIVIFRGFDRLFSVNQPFAIVYLLFNLFTSLPQLISTPQQGKQEGQPASLPQLGGQEIAAIIVGLSLALFVAFVLSVVVSGVINYFAWKTSRDERAYFTESIRAVFDKFWTIAGVLIISGLKVLGGILLFIVPGVRAAIRYQMVLFPVFDENMRAREAINRTKALTKGHLLEIGGMSVAAAIIPFIGSLLQVGGESIIYNNLKQLEKGEVERPKTHILNWLLVYALVPIVLLIAGGLIALIYFSAK